jgi:hypothetical protein
MYGTNAVQRLEEKLDYETWILSFLSDEIEPFPSGDARAEINEDGSRHIAVTATTSISQARVDKIVQRMYPLVFTASYKALDMQMEWILEEHDSQGIISGVPWRFSEKIDELEDLENDNDLRLPSIYNQEKSLYDRVFALFRDLNGHRNTIIHGEDFEVSDDELEITDRSGTTFQFDTEELFAFAKVASITADSLKSGTLDPYTKRELQAFLDYLVFAHGEPAYGCTPPWSPTLEKGVEAESEDPDTFEVDIEKIWEAFEAFPDADGFYLNVVGNRGVEDAVEWRIPSDELPEQGEIVLSTDGGAWSNWRIN